MALLRSGFQWEYTVFRGDDYLRPRLNDLKSRDLKMRITLRPINTDFVDHGEYFARQYGDVALKSSSTCSQLQEPGAYEPW